MAKIVGRDPATGEGLAVSVEGGKISAIQSCDAPDQSYLAAGLIDLQVNGFGGHDLNDGRLTPVGVEKLAEKLAATGVTTFLPTVITASQTRITEALGTLAQARKSAPWLARMIRCVHVEGPHISPEDGPRGAHPRAHVRAPDTAEFGRWQEACGGLVGMVTLSPHWDEAPDYIRHLAAHGVHVALGHTDATHEQISRAAAAGASLSTHLGNGAAAVLPRHPNLIWSQLADDRLTATFIADGHHLPPETFKAMLRAKGLARSLLVSDVTALGGMAPGTYDQPIGGRVVLSAEGRLGTEGTPYLAGAALPLAHGVATAISHGGLCLAEALGLATVNPGRFAGCRGRLEIGAVADLIRFDWQPGDRSLAIRASYVAGEKRFEA